MICRIFDWLVAGAGPTTLQHALVGIACLLTYDAVARWRKKRPAQDAGRSETVAEHQRRRAA